MSFPGAPVFLLPPHPARRDWPLAGACAGLLLGLAELAFAAPDGPPVRLAFLAVTCLALALGLAAGSLGLALHGLRSRPSYSALVAWVAGLIGVAAATPLALPHADRSSLPALAALLLATLAMASAAFAAARLATRSERSGTPANALLIWGAAATAVAAGERASLGGPALGVAPLALLGGLVLGGAGVASALFSFARRRGSSRPRATFARLFGLLAVAALTAAIAPRALPWIVAERDLPPWSGAPAHILIVVAGPAVGGGASVAQGMGTLAGWSGIRYEPRVSEPTRALEALLTLPDGAALVPALAADGYATAAILADARLAPAIGAREVDARPGGRAQLERELRWLAVAPWLAGPGRPVLERLGLDGDARSPAQLAEDARGWLLRRGASTSPFFLFIDFRPLGTLDAAESAREEEAAATLLEHLDQTGLAERTVVLLARIGGEREPPLRVVVRPPGAWPRSEGEAFVARPVQASELGAALWQIARGDGVTPIAFPGVISAPSSPAREARSEQ